MSPAALLHPGEMVVRAVEVRHQGPTKAGPEQFIDDRTGAMGIPVEETGGRRGERPDKARNTIFPPPGLIRMDHRAGTHLSLECLIHRLRGSCHLAQQSHDATTRKVQPMLPLQPLLDQSNGEPFDRGHGCHLGQESGTEAAPSHPTGHHTGQGWKDPLLTPGTLSAEQHMLGHDRRLGRWQFDHLQTTMDPSPGEMSSTARTGLDRMSHPLVDLRHPVPSTVVPVIPFLPRRLLPLRLGPLTRPGTRQWLGSVSY